MNDFITPGDRADKGELNMKVILLSELKGRGGEGDIIDVRQGYAENYLYPNKIAVAATEGNLKQLEQRSANIAKREAVRVTDAEKIKESTDGKTISVKAKVGEDGQLFGSITTPMIAEAIKEQLGVEIDRKRLETRGAIKNAGMHRIEILIYRETRSELFLSVKDIEGKFVPETDEEAEKVEDVATDAEAPVEEAAADEDEATAEADQDEDENAEVEA